MALQLAYDMADGAVTEIPGSSYQHGDVVDLCGCCIRADGALWHVDFGNPDVLLQRCDKLTKKHCLSPGATPFPNAG